MSQPPYLPPNHMPGAKQRRETGGRPPSSGGIPGWQMMVGSTFLTAIVSVIVMLLLYSPGRYELELTAIAAITQTAEYTPPPTATPIPPDVDRDTILDEDDNCQTIGNTEQTDLDGDGIGNVCDEDIDGDEIPNDDDNCPLTPRVSSIDTDEDGQGDPCDADDDQDSIEDEPDNCPLVSNPGQEDMDGDGLGDACDASLDLIGIQITTTASEPLYIGQIQNETPLQVSYTSQADMTEDARVQIAASEGSLRPEGQSCADAAGSVITLSALPTTLIYCPPAEEPDDALIITAREIDSESHTMGNGGFLTLQAVRETLMPVIERGRPLTFASTLDPATFNRCTLSAPVNGLDLEQFAIPLLFRLQTDPDTESGRVYPVTLSIPLGQLYAFDARTCQQIGTDALSGEAVLAADINQGYLFFYVPDPAVTDTTIRASVADETISFVIPPVLVATQRINFADNGGTLVSHITEGGRALIVGIGTEGWVQVQIDADERDLWVNIENERNSTAYTLLGPLSAAPTVQTPNFP